MPLEYVDGSNAQIYTYLDTKFEKLYALKFIAKRNFTDGFEKMFEVFDQEVSILEMIK